MHIKIINIIYYIISINIVTSVVVIKPVIILRIWNVNIYIYIHCVNLINVNMHTIII
jgi:hypothetical protein